MEIEPAGGALRGRVGVVRLGLSRWLGRLSGAGLASPAALAAVEILFNPWSHAAWLPIWRTVLLGGVGSAIALAVASALIAAIRPMREGSLRVDGADVVMEAGTETRRTPVAAIAAGIVVPDPVQARVELELGSGDRIVAEVDDIANGERVLEALGLDAARRRCTIPFETRAYHLKKRVGAVVAAILAGLFVLGKVANGAPITTASAAIWLSATTAGVLLATRLTRVREITIGADGVRLGKRFVRLDQVASVRRDGWRIALHLRDGGVVWLPSSSDQDAARAVALRIEEALRAHTRAPDARATLDLLARGGRTLAEWRAALGRLTGRASGYREAGLSGDDLAAILANPASSSEHRMGAALALVSIEDSGRRRHLRIAADACASEPMRIALDKLAGGEIDERAVEEALAGDEAEARPDTDQIGAPSVQAESPRPLGS